MTPAALIAGWLVATASAGVLGGQDRGATAGGFLKIGPGARAAGLGEAFVAAADDATALYWNPAAMVRVAGTSLSLMHATHWDSGFHDHGALAHRLGRSAVGTGFQFFSHGNIQETDSAGADVGAFAPQDMAVSAGLARALPWLSVGVSGKFVRSRIVRSAATAAADLGVLSAGLFGGRVRLGAAAANLGGKLKYDLRSYQLPVVVRLGGTVEPFPWWLIAIDGVLPRDAGGYLAAGSEFRVAADPRSSVALRVGYNTRTTRSVGGGSGLSGGVGLSFGRLSFDYAVASFGSLGYSHRVSMSLRFPDRGGGPGPAAQAMGTRAEERYDRLVRAARDMVHDPGEALLLAGQAEQLRPDAPEAVMLAGGILYSRGEVDAAQERFERGLALLRLGDTRRAQVHERLGRILYLRGKTAAALKHYQAALAEAGKTTVEDRVTADAMVGEGMCLRRLGRKGALQRLRQGLGHGKGPGAEMSAEAEFLLTPAETRPGKQGVEAP